MPRPNNGAFLISVATMSLFLPQSAAAQVAEGEPQEIGFSGLATFDIQVRDRDEAIQWFSQVLGFEHLFTEESMNWAEVRSPVDNVTVGIEEIRDRPIRTSNIDFGVRDIEVARRAIEARGGVFVGETTDYGPVLIARLRDPSGNMFNLFQGK
jgi:predicted enzyme related to lactoylglutathione lyase